MGRESTTLLIALFWIVGSIASLFVNGLIGIVFWQLITIVLIGMLAENYKCECGQYHIPGVKTNCVFYNDIEKERGDKKWQKGF